MKRSIINIAIALCISPLLMQCAAEKDVRGLDMRLRSADAKVAEIDTTVAAMKYQRESLAEQSSQIEKLRSRLLQQEALLEERNIQTKKILDEQASLKKNTTKQIEQLHAQIEQLRAQSEHQRIQLGDIIGRLNGVNAQVATVSDDFTRIQEEQAREAAERAAGAARAAEEARRKAEIASAPKSIEPEQLKKKPGKSEEPAKPGESAQHASNDMEMQEAETNTSDAMYNKGLAAFKANKYKEAYNAFSSYLEKNRTSPLAPNARFWLGECFFQQKEFELAILEYQKVIADYPKSAKAPAALYKQGLAFEKLVEKDTAKIVYNKLLADYPKSEQYEMAQKRLKELK